jgi:GNAT superfamily N-acetyltransferase
MISKFSAGQENEISDLVRSVFDEFIGFKYSKKGNEVFHDFIDPQNILERYQSGNIILIYLINNKIAGVIEVRDNYHICLFFVHKDLQGKGIGRKLFDEIKYTLRGKTDFVDVNASPNSVTVYSKLGFKIIDYQKDENGMIYTPMKYEYK